MGFTGIKCDKFDIPTIPSNIIVRKKLIRTFQENCNKRIMYVNAPIGYGKTVSVILWVRYQKKKSIWITLDPYNNSPDAFKELIMQVLQQCATAKSERRLLVIDDFHSITHEKVYEVLYYFIKRLPAEWHIILLSRQSPSANLYQYVLAEEMAVIDVEQLRFTSGEIKELFARHGKILDNSDANNILSETNGWIMAIHAILMSENKLYSKKLIKECMEKCFRVHIWDNCSKDVQQFMLSTCILDTLDKDLCLEIFSEYNVDSIFNELYMNNFLLEQKNEQTYSYYGLLKYFLTEISKQENNMNEVEIFKKVADYFLKQRDYYAASKYFFQLKDYERMNHAMILADMDDTYISVEKSVSIIESLKLEEINKDVLMKYPYLLEQYIYLLFANGRSEEFLDFLDKLYQELPELLEKNSLFTEVIMFFKELDFRRSIYQVTKDTIAIASSNNRIRIRSLSMNFPFLHRSNRDYSECANRLNKAFPYIRDSFFKIAGRSYDAIEYSIAAGILYEKNLLNEALEYAILAESKVNKNNTSEIKFCVKMILSVILRAKGTILEAKKVEDSITSMLENDNSYYLQPNMKAYSYKLKIQNGDSMAAKEWLSRYSDTYDDILSFYKIFKYFTTARAYILNGEYNIALLFLTKLIKLSDDYNRPLDRIEANVLYAIAWWKNGRYNQSMEALEEAIKIAYPYLFIRIFVEVADDIKIMIHKYCGKVKRNKSYDQDFIQFVRKIELVVNEVYKRSGRTERYGKANTIKLSKQQQVVINLLNKGYSYMEMAEEIGVQLPTIKTHVSGAYLKLGVTNAVDAIAKMKTWGLLEDEELSK